jgi:hypothetical protein
MLEGIHCDVGPERERRQHDLTSKGLLTPEVEMLDAPVLVDGIDDRVATLPPAFVCSWTDRWSRSRLGARGR